nr:hypothetical protein [Providencia rettgeri]
MTSFEIQNVILEFAERDAVFLLINSSDREIAIEKLQDALANKLKSNLCIQVTPTNANTRYFYYSLWGTWQEVDRVFVERMRFYDHHYLNQMVAYDLSQTETTPLNNFNVNLS